MKKTKQILYDVSVIYILCFVFRIFEYFVMRTDQTFWGEAFVHKVIGIILLFAAMKRLGFNTAEIGFAKEKTVVNLVKGLVFGICTFAIAYMAEAMAIFVQGGFEGIDVYVSAYAVDGNIGNRTELIFFVICIIGNVINVVMEEGVFRGLIPRILERKYSFVISAVIASCLFGVWHMIAPIRSYCDGVMSAGGCVANMAMLIGTSALVGFKFAMLTKLTGSGYMAMGDHFVNNTIVNMLHVVSATGADELMVIRLSIAQTISFVVVLVWFVLRRRCDLKAVA